MGLIDFLASQVLAFVLSAAVLGLLAGAAWKVLVLSDADQLSISFG